jgi:23S rRNA (pseudouridine1915-N3)-methyltransferase
MDIHLIAVGRMKTGPVKDVFQDYVKRLHTPFKITEIDIRDQGSDTTLREHQAIMKAVDPSSPLIVLDERGKTISSIALADTFRKLIDQSPKTIQIVIGGADGLSDEIRAMARHMISFGAMTWPHMLVRVMLAEQLYRTQQILSGHPYHREG